MADAVRRGGNRLLAVLITGIPYSRRASAGQLLLAKASKTLLFRNGKLRQQSVRLVTKICASAYRLTIPFPVNYRAIISCLSHRLQPEAAGGKAAK